MEIRCVFTQTFSFFPPSLCAPLRFPHTVLRAAVSALTVSLPALHSICIMAPSSYSDFCISSVNVYINRAARGGSGGPASTQSAPWPFAASCQQPALLKNVRYTRAPCGHVKVMLAPPVMSCGYRLFGGRKLQC